MGTLGNLSFMSNAWLLPPLHSPHQHMTPHLPSLHLARCPRTATKPVFIRICEHSSTMIQPAQRDEADLSNRPNLPHLKLRLAPSSFHPPAPSTFLLLLPLFFRYGPLFSILLLLLLLLPLLLSNTICLNHFKFPRTKSQELFSCVPFKF